MHFSKIKIDKHRIIFIKFEDIFKNIEVKLINDLNDYNLIKNNVIDLRNKDTRRLLYHYIIKQTCDIVVETKKKYKFDVVIAYNTIFTSKSEICRYIDCNKLYDQIIRLLKNIQTNLPIMFYKIPKFDESYFHSGEGLDILNIFIAHTMKKSTKKNEDFSEITKFAKKNGLTFIKETYFNELSAKYLLN